MKRCKIIHPEHPCQICASPTTNKSYCDKHEQMIIPPPPYTPGRGNYISAEFDGTIGRRRETYDGLRIP